MTWLNWSAIVQQILKKKQLKSHNKSEKLDVLVIAA